MSNIRLFFSESLSKNLITSLNKSQSHYISKVMRLKRHEFFSVFNNSGEWEAQIKEVLRAQHHRLRSFFLPEVEADKPA